ncbi:MAG: PhoH family protein [Gammaproteobacteria bacterium]|nr:PhoH family protein [Gammaproteobacteria bacterium]
MSDLKLYVLDTNILLHEPNAVFSFNEHDVVIPMTVLEELDQIKDRHKDVSRDARIAIRTIEDILSSASSEAILSGVPIPCSGLTEKLGTLAIFPDHQLTTNTGSLPGDINDNKIINAALHLQQHHPSRVVVLITKDINMRLKAKGAGMANVEDYRSDHVVSDVQYLSKGYHHYTGDFWNNISQCDTHSNGRHTIHTVARADLAPSFVNQFMFDDSEHFCARVTRCDDNSVSFIDVSRERLLHRKAWGVRAKNVYQGMALDALLDPSIELVMLTGAAGSGKTLLAMAAALEQVIEKKRYNKIIVTRNTPEIAESIGFLPGTEEEKMAPWLAAVTDSLEALHGGDDCPQGSINYIFEKANIQFKSINFMRGRSIQRAFVLLDECQNLTASQLKTIITRCGEGTKIVCLGNLAQIDSNYLTAVSSGLTYIVETFKDFEGSSVVHLNGVVRSRLAKFAEEHM